jgi:hypothetical protein
VINVNLVMPIVIKVITRIQVLNKFGNAKVTETIEDGDSESKFSFLGRFGGI